MRTLPSAADVERLRGFVRERIGFALDDGRADDIAAIFEDRLRELGCDGPAAYFGRLASPAAARDEVRAIAARLTVGESYFFRTPDHFRAFVDVALPARLRARPADRRLRVLSAGCACGEEPYTLAILLRERVDRRDLDLVALDVNAAFLERARAGRYGAWSLRETPPAERDRWFRQEGREFVLDDDVRSLVRFEERNLLDDDPAFWAPGAFDAIFCRNAVIYFSPEVMARVVARFARALAPGGFLFLGHAETLRGISHDFHLRHSHDTFYYERKGGPDGAPSGPLPPLGAAAAPPLEDGAWVDEIRRASERIEALASRAGAPRETPPSAAAAPREAAPPVARRDDPDALLAEAASLAVRGALAEAEAACRRVLALDELSAGAHYVAAVCREHAGDLAGARDHDLTAVYLDPLFSLPRLHLGLLARRAGDRDGARRELEHALPLLEREDAARIVLLGGGFRREALVELCRAQLKACGGAP